MKFDEKVESILTEKDIESMNINIGIDKNAKKGKQQIDKLEKWLDKNGIYFTNEGGDKDTYNINAGFNKSDIPILSKEFEKLANSLSTTSSPIYIDTETF